MTDDPGLPFGVVLRTGAGQTLDGARDAAASHAPWGSLQAELVAEERRNAVAEMYRQNPERYGATPPLRETVTVWETDRWGEQRAVGTRPAPRPRHTGRMVVAAQPGGADHDGDDTMSDLLSNRSQPSPHSTFE